MPTDLHFSNPEAAAWDLSFPVVGIGASAGGLEACRNFVRSLPPKPGMVFVLIQHLDPVHESVIADLLGSQTQLVVTQAVDGMPVEADHLYVIPPGTYLAVRGGLLHVTPPEARHGARLPVDFFFHSLAAAYGARAVAIILSGTGADGSLGLLSVHQGGGLVIAQNPDEAGYDGMPRAAMRTGKVDLVLPVGRIPAALSHFATSGSHTGPGDPPLPDAPDLLPAIIALLRADTAHDFTLYKQGTLQRRIIRRMALAGIPQQAMDLYLQKLRTDTTELDQLANDLLINVTSFFRDPAVFQILADQIIPELISRSQADQPIRIWIPGCSTGEEAYSLAILFREHMIRTNTHLKLQFFASDVDADAIAIAREGYYADSVAADISPTRLAQFFSKDGHGYRIAQDLRTAVVFTVHDVLIDPPFSRLDMISCRNLLIYLLPPAQERVFGLFHFGLRKDGILLLGASESVGDRDRRFEVMSKPAHIFRHIGHPRPGEYRLPVANRGGPRSVTPAGQSQAASRQTMLADLARRLVIESHAPAAILINRRNECLYSLGPITSYVHVPPGHPTQDLIAMVAPAMRTRLRSAIQRATQGNSRVIMAGDSESGEPQRPFSIDVQPVVHDGETLLLVCFVEAPSAQALAPAGRDGRADDALEQELESTRDALRSAIHDLEISNEEQKAINDEASSLNEELQSTNEELLTSKEELQSINEETIALNTQLLDTLARQRTTSNDLQNVLNSTNVATIFLDLDLHIRFFTPATRALFNVIQGDIGRPLSDLKALAADSQLLADARTVLVSCGTIEREIETQSGVWFVRRIMPYLTEDAMVEGVVITFVDSTERRQIADDLEAARHQAELASIAKSRFLAAASHDLRQPLQSLSLIRGVLAKKVAEGKTEEALELLKRLEDTSASMSGMLNSLLDITQIDGGNIAAEVTRFPVNDLLNHLAGEFGLLAAEQGLMLRVVPSNATISSDQYLLGQILRNLLSNALKYTKHGKVLLGCRRHGGVLCIDVCDTGVGIAASELDAIFNEYHQIGNGERQRSRGLGLGLAIVRRLANLLGHEVRVQSTPGKGSIFSIAIGTVAAGTSSVKLAPRPAVAFTTNRSGAILIVEDDPDVRDLLSMVLKEEGHHTTTAVDGVAALALLANGMIRPDLLLADFNLPNGLTGLQLAVKLRQQLNRNIPAIILTGDISADTMRDITRQNCVKLNKPVQVQELMQTIQPLLPPAPAPVSGKANVLAPATIYVVDDDPFICDAMRLVFEDVGRQVEVFGSAEAFLAGYRADRPGCVLVDAYLPGISGLALLQRLHAQGHPPPAIMVTGHSDVQMVVAAMQAGAVDFIEKPISREDLLASVDRALEQARDIGKLVAWQEEAAGHIANLTSRQREIMEMVLAGHPSKNIAADLNISQRTVENHRAEIMRRTGTKSLPALARMAISAIPAARLT